MSYISEDWIAHKKVILTWRYEKKFNNVIIKTVEVMYIINKPEGTWIIAHFGELLSI